MRQGVLSRTFSGIIWAAIRPMNISESVLLLYSGAQALFVLNLEGYSVGCNPFLKGFVMLYEDHGGGIFCKKCLYLHAGEYIYKI